MKWTEEDTYKFVGLYREHECLWNTAKTNYKNKNMRQRAVEDIVRAMGREGFGAVEVKQKIKNIRSTYSQEIQKIRRTNRPGTSPEDVYRPNVKWFHMMDEIIKSSKEPTEIRTNLDPLVDIELENEQAAEEDATVDDQEKTLEKQPTQQPPPPYGASHTFDTGQVTRPTFSNTKKLNKGTKRRLHDLSQAVNELGTLNMVLRKQETSSRENEAFSGYVASVLQKLPEKEAILAQNEIQNILTRYRLSTISTHPKSNYTLFNQNNRTPQSYTSPTLTPSPSTTNINTPHTNGQEREIEVIDIKTEPWHS